MTPSADLQIFLKAWEGNVLVPYQDSGGQWTVGVGHLLPHNANRQPWTQDQVDCQLRWDLNTIGMGVQRSLTLPAMQNQYDAMVSLAFNIGIHALGGSTLLRMFNNGDVQATAQQFLVWDHVHGQEVPGLLKRREAERNIFINADYSGRP